MTRKREVIQLKTKYLLMIKSLIILKRKRFKRSREEEQILLRLSEVYYRKQKG